MEKKADAWKEYNEAAIIQQLIEQMPEVANAIAQPLAKTDSITVISTGGNGQGSGASAVAQDTANMVAQIPALVKALTGIDLIELIKELPAMQSNRKTPGTVTRPTVTSSRLRPAALLRMRATSRLKHSPCTAKT